MTKAKATPSRKETRRRVSDLRVGLLAYFVGDRHVFAVLSGKDGHLETFRLMGFSELGRRTDELFDAMDDRCSPQHADNLFEDFATGWGCELIPKTINLNDFDVIVIIPHFLLHGVPLHLVQIEDHIPLGLHVSITYVSSGAAFLKAISRNKVRLFDLSKWQFPVDQSQPLECPPPPGRCLSFASDVLGSRTAEFVDLANSIDAFFKYHARLDLREAAALLGERAVLKSTLFETSKEDVRGDVYLIISHGYVDNSYPELSGLLLRGSNRGYLERQIMFLDHPYLFKDLPFRYFPPEVNARPELNAEVLTAAELLVDCKVEAELVGLLACSTSAGGLACGDEVITIAHQWLKVGAASALASLWPLDFQVAQEWLPKFFDNWLRKRQPKAIAARDAWREQINQRYLPLRKWGALSLYGDWL